MMQLTGFGNGERDNAPDAGFTRRVEEWVTVDELVEDLHARKQRVYLSGPMSGYENFNFPAFAEAAKWLRAQGFSVFSPAELGWGDGDPVKGEVSEAEYLEFLRKDIREVSESDLIVLLPGWETSRGANFELDVARKLGLEVWFFVRNPVDGSHYLRSDDPADETMKATNPKDAVGSTKLPLHLWPETATVLGTLGLLEGMLKYGRSNWREAGVRASIYVDALRRHVDAWFEGEDCAPDSGLPHLAHALACLAILVDAEAAGKLTDDRQYNGAGLRRLVDEVTPHVERLKQLYADKDPHHYTIADGA